MFVEHLWKGLDRARSADDFAVDDIVYECALDDLGLIANRGDGKEIEVIISKEVHIVIG
jgi:hypothetical protein